MKIALLTLFVSLNFYAQTQIGDNINGTNMSDQLGANVSLSNNGSTIAVSSLNYVRVYKNINNIWTQIGQDIVDSDQAATEGVNISLSDDGDVIALSSRFKDKDGTFLGKIRIYKNEGNIWTQIGQNIVGSNSKKIEVSISLSGNGKVIAFQRKLNSPNPHKVSIYKNINGIWNQIGSDIVGENELDWFGYSLSLSNDGNIIAIGAPNAYGIKGYNSGHVRIYKNINNVWTQVGEDIDGERGGNTIHAGGDGSGYSISLSDNGNIIAIGAPYNYINFPSEGYNAGHVRIYKNINNVWTQIGTEINGEDMIDEFGASVSISNDGTIVAIGATYASTIPGPRYGPGHVRVYQNINDKWTKTGTDIYGVSIGDEFGASVSLSGDGNTLSIGANSADGGNKSNSGQVQVYDLSAILSTKEIQLSKIGIFPNPAKNQISIKLHQGNQLKKISLYTSYGQYINSFNTNIINTTKFSRGIYFLKIETTERKIAVKKIILK